MPHVGIEPETATFATQADAQLTKCADGAGNEIALPHICD